ncbi:hypothetical protein [Nonomuraea sp. SBT364]|uniref:hypothetical protein n=1 Tax=Nonomuraea sp. SBT364 TaxID=1580530 RepID=UPI00066D8DE7|nr:hypothetical protein [Nonomuraea sp. SBT364]
MAYENDRTIFMTALGTATAAALFVPYALPIVGLLATMLGDPAEQHRASEQWLNTTPVDAAPESAGSGQSDLAFLRTELQRMTREIGQNDGWEGKAYASFQEKVNVLDQHLATLDQNRISCGNTLSCTAQGFHVLTLVASAVAAALTVLAAFVAICRTSVVAAPEGETIALTTSQRLYAAVARIYANHGKLIAKAGLIMSIAGVAYNQFAQELPGLQAVSGEKPNLIEASAMWDPSTSDMVDNPQAQFDPGQMESPMPEFGF